MKTPSPVIVQDSVASEATTSEVPESIAIKGINESTITSYFETLNAGDFQVTGNLFATEGALHPPFEQPIVGPEAIANYLEQEAKGFKLQPKQGVINLLEDNSKEVEVSGKVHTPLFSVNVLWRFILNTDQEIVLAKIKLLASPKELLSLRQ